MRNCSRWSLLIFLTSIVIVSSQPVYPQQEGLGKTKDRTELWHKLGKNILDGFTNMYNFHVLHVPSGEYPYRAWFFGWSVEDCNRHIPGFTGCDAIFTARAKHVEGPWEVYAGEGIWDKSGNPRLWQPLFSPLGTYFDEWHNGDPSVIKLGKTYYMAYSATGHDKDRIPEGRDGDTDGSYYCIMGAISQDGIHWERSHKPILAYEKEYGGKEKTGDVVLFGSYHRPSIMYEEGKFKMWFDYWSPWGVSMGYAENKGDFLRAEDWVIIRGGENPCIKGFPNPDVVKINKLYFAFADPGGYEPHPWTGRKITEAVSKDGLNWIILGFIQPDSDTPAIHVPEAIPIYEKDKPILCLFYSCQIGGVQDKYDFRYNRIRVMQREITNEEIVRFFGND